MKTFIIALAALVLGAAANAQILKPVKWKYTVQKVSATEAVVSISANIDKGWHIYGLTVPNDGPVKTTVTFDFDKASFPVGKIIAPKPLNHFEETFNTTVSYYEKSVTFQQKFRITPKSKAIRGSIEYMVCNNLQCLPPDTAEFEIPIH
ncbi:Disulphide bond corrector protein DsbC [Dyadobacter soli]|uniref:Disulphide bond corrector protein DsbC n=1 Tax=Dyadobacter soli TaxID=659014 RepID=A0A1G6VSM6_9BACT|nr:protein-disulfide reductase DsbD domain-containing protein [Dyadobacter soli]SDD55987.1 Disulphide bond corrector protein DsbC [Dyadobacter soli]